MERLGPGRVEVGTLSGRQKSARQHLRSRQQLQARGGQERRQQRSQVLFSQIITGLIILDVIRT